MRASPATGRNLLLSRLPEDTLERWSPHLAVVELKLGQVLYEPGATVQHVHFPSTALVSLLHVLQDGSMAEIAVVGCEGVVGLPAFLDGGRAPGLCVVQAAGTAWRLPAAQVRREAERSWQTTRVLLRFAQALLVQVAQTAACNRHHTIDQQLCRWLLLSLDRIRGDDLEMTQELIANMLGVRRAGVTLAAARLQREGLISYSRGHIRLLDREGLRRCACECYDTVRREYDRLLSGPLPPER